MIIHVKANIPYISNALCEISRFSFEIMECVRIHKMCGRVKCDKNIINKGIRLYKRV